VWAWVIAAPVGFMLMTLILAWLEERVVFPDDRATQINKLLEHEHAEEVEGSVARMLAPVVPRRHAS
jgi:hypothetical protein